MLNKFINYILCDIINENNFKHDIVNINKYINELILTIYHYNKIKYLVNNKGKRLRSLLALYCYYKYTNRNSYNINELYKILAVVELTHFASLLHDDVIDNNNHRRNEKSLNYKYGNKNSILMGDYILIKNFNYLLQILNNKDYNKYITNQFLKASIDTVYGVSLENSFRFENIFNNLYKNNNTYYIKHNNIKNNQIINLQNIFENTSLCIKISKLKTGSLFKFSCIIGSILSNTTFNYVKQSALFGLLFGIIYQIQDDINDYKYCDNYTQSEDYMQNNITLPIIILHSLFNIERLFYNKNQANFNKIQVLINTKKFQDTTNIIMKPYINFSEKIINGK